MDEQKESAAPRDGQPGNIPNTAEASSSKQPAAPSDGPADMPSRPRPNTPKRDVDLSSLLSLSDKIELVSFIGKATETMHKHIIQVFDSTGLDDSNPPCRTSYWARLPLHLRDLSLVTPQKRSDPRVATQGANQKENIKAHASWSATAGAANHAPVSDPPSPTAEHDQAPRLQELKKEVLLHFKKWQAAIQKRVGDISVKRTNEPQGGSSSYGGVGRGRGFNRGKQQRESKTFSVEADQLLTRLYPPIPTSLSSMSVERRAMLLHSLILLFLSLEHYSAYTRVLLLHVTSSLLLPMRMLAEDEVRVAKSLAIAIKDISADELMQKKAEEGKSARKWKVAMAGAAGAALVGATGALAAPLVAAGIGSVLGGMGIGSAATAGLLGTVAESGLLVGSIFGIYGARATGKAMEQYTKDIQEFAFIPLRGSVGEDSEIGKIGPDNRRFRVVLAISGWLTSESDVAGPWHALGEQSEVYAVRWEPDPLIKMGTALETVIKSAAWSLAKKEIIARTIFATMSQGLWPLSLLKISKIIDNPWSIGMVRADKTGAVLADIIMSKAQGERGVSLIGYSLGARAIYVCLMILAERRVFSLVENVVMMGAPAPANAATWCALKSVVSGRLVNVYSQNDYILGFLYRTGSIQFGVAGLQKIEGIDGVENVDVSAKVSGHLRYQHLVGSILKHIGWEDIDIQKVSEDEAALAKVEEKNRARERKRDEVEFGDNVRVLEQDTKRKTEQEAIRTRKTKGKMKAKK
ncbi:hypothetical protein QBC34DRAFT_391320 [Podospora aff. communis PSN243]|uniref:Transmembrane and coiled-coil domain-containing protein n=1 Tax=Podospora aff. communis PSN243 TaxID=3040156 RepID=A0AAV9H4W8_9PEZI|nr:hypothetical protein QBC34DRAFT_391320 [Podospora aff. communis PSN243]